MNIKRCECKRLCNQARILKLQAIPLEKEAHKLFTQACLLNQQASKLEKQAHALAHSSYEPPPEHLTLRPARASMSISALSKRLGLPPDLFLSERSILS